jgi:hypothetical protein
MRKKRSAAVLASTVAVAGAMTAFAPEALAAYGPSYCNSSSCGLWGGPSTANHITEVPRGAGVTMMCWTDNQWYNGTNRWFKVDTAYGRGYMIATQVSNQQAKPHC